MFPPGPALFRVLVKACMTTLSTLMAQPDVAPERRPRRPGSASGVTTHVLIARLCRTSGQPPLQVLTTPGGLGSQSGQSSVNTRTHLLLRSVLVWNNMLLPYSRRQYQRQGLHAVCREWGGTSGVHELLLGGSHLCWYQLAAPGAPGDVHISFPAANYCNNSCSFNLIPIRCLGYTPPHVCPTTPCWEQRTANFCSHCGRPGQDQGPWSGSGSQGHTQQVNKSAWMERSRRGRDLPRVTPQAFPRNVSTVCTEPDPQPLHKFFTLQMWKQTLPRAENCVKFSRPLYCDPFF